MKEKELPKVYIPSDVRTDGHPAQTVDERQDPRLLRLIFCVPGAAFASRQ